MTDDGEEADPIEVARADVINLARTGTARIGRGSHTEVTALDGAQELLDQIDIDDSDEFGPIQIGLSRAVYRQVAAGAALTRQTPASYMEQAILTQLQALDNVLHGDEHIDLPPDFDRAEWRERHQAIMENLDQ